MSSIVIASLAMTDHGCHPVSVMISPETGEINVARYSFSGIEPLVRFWLAVKDESAATDRLPGLVTDQLAR